MAHPLDDKAVRLAKDYLHTEGEILATLVAMREQRLFPALGFAGIWEYCVHRLRLSNAQAYYFKTVADKRELHAPVMNGELTLSEARRIATVVTPENKEEWIEKAKTLPQKQLEREVTAVNPRAHIREKIRPIAPELSELRVPVDRATEDDLKVLTEILSQKSGKAASLADVIRWAAQVTRDRHDPLRRAARARNILSAGKPKPGRQPIPAAIKHAVTRRDGNRCTHVSNGRRCEARRWLHLHHLREVARGGANSVDNLATVCAAHHRARHGGGAKSQRENVHEPWNALPAMCKHPPSL